MLFITEYKCMVFFKGKISYCLARLQLSDHRSKEFLVSTVDIQFILFAVYKFKVFKGLIVNYFLKRLLQIILKHYICKVAR